MKVTHRRFLDGALSSALALALLSGCAHHGDEVRPEQSDKNTGSAGSGTQTIAEDAFIYGFPMVRNYAVMNDYFINKSSGQYKCSFNKLFNTARVYTPEDTVVVTPNSDTPYSFFCADLRAEPLVVSVPEIEKKRYYSVQLVDMYTYNYGYIGSRATGSDAGKFLIAGPRWKGEKPAGIEQVFRCETDFSFGIFRTQLFSPSDIDAVKKIQAGYGLETLSAFLGKPAPPAAPAIEWPKIDKQLAKASPFEYLNFVLQFCPLLGPAEVEKPLRDRFASIGVEAGKPFSPANLGAQQKAELAAGMKSGLEKIEARVATIGKDINGWRVGSSLGDRAFFKGDWTLRAAAAAAGIYGNDAVEATYPLTRHDADGEPLDGSKHDYTLTFPAGQFPPVNAFWSVTMYDGKTQLLIENPLHRYLINSPMLPGLKKSSDGSLTLYIQKDSPGGDKESNWLPAPNGPIYMVLRLYWPKTEAPSVLPAGSGSWKTPGVMKVK
jgi:hypothetical protein